MKVTTDWLAHPAAIGGIDHLGTQAPCQLIYSQLIPGITNVTDRARYYALYPWLICTFDRRFPKAEAAEFVKLFRRGDFLLTLIADRHARVLEEPDGWHGAAMAGRTQTPTAMAQLEASGAIDLEVFTTTDEVPTRYFKSRLGGLSQYYVGILTELGLLDTATQQWVKYTQELGEHLADAVDMGVPADRFWSVVEAGHATTNDLDALYSFCPCGLQVESEEHTMLLNLFFAKVEPFAATGKQRRLSLGMWLYLAQALSGTAREFNMSTFRGAIYANSLPGGMPWPLPESLQPTRALWGLYEANDLLSVGFLGVFASALDQLAHRQASGRGSYASIEALAVDVSQGALGDALVAAFGVEQFSEVIGTLKASAPALGDWLNPRHEHELCDQLMTQWRAGASDSDRLITAIEMIALLIARDKTDRPAYGGLAITADELRNYPINLQTLRHRAVRWSTCSVRAVLEDAVTWCLSTHLSVALRKLRQTGRSTFRFRPGERGLEITEEAPRPTRTTPRFNQASQVLIDLRTLQHGSDTNGQDLEVTELGRRMMANHGQ
jgi:hypothetical protein